MVPILNTVLFKTLHFSTYNTVLVKCNVFPCAHTFHVQVSRMPSLFTIAAQLCNCHGICYHLGPSCFVWNNAKSMLGWLNQPLQWWAQRRHHLMEELHHQGSPQAFLLACPQACLLHSLVMMGLQTFSSSFC